MTVLAGQRIIAGQIPGWPIEVVEVTADSSDFTTTEVVVVTITASLVNGHTYRVTGVPGFSSSATGDVITARLRQDSLTGTGIDSDSIETYFNTSFRASKAQVIGLYTATASGNKTFVITAEREGGTGDCRLEGASDGRSNLLDVRYEYGP